MRQFVRKRPALLGIIMIGVMGAVLLTGQVSGTIAEKGVSTMTADNGADKAVDWKALSEKEWKERLTAEEFRILRKQGTERAFTGDLVNNKDTGTYTCAGCGEALFKSDHKFNSGTGWPSFWDANKGTIGTETDRSFFMVRTEVHCKTCGGHLGHVFEDGPDPTGLRYCINSAALNFQGKDTHDTPQNQ